MITLYAVAFLTGFGMFSLPGHSPLGEFARAAVVGWLVSAAAQSLPAPDASSGKLYRFAYKFLNVIGANLTHAGLTQPPSAEKGKGD